MPSLFARQRRASESMPAEPAADPLHPARKSLDTSRPPVSGHKFKSLFGSHSKDEDPSSTRRRSSVSHIFGGDEEGSNSLRKRLSNASQIFHKTPSEQQTPKVLVPASPTSPQTPAAAATSPRSPPRPIQFPVVPSENFALSGTSSPEGAARGRSSWQPSYPTVLAEDSYAGPSPHGHPAFDQRVPVPTELPSENKFRRSTYANIPTPSPDELPARPITPPRGPAPLPTPPPSATTPSRELPSEAVSDAPALGDTSQATATEDAKRSEQETVSSEGVNGTARPAESIAVTAPSSSYAKSGKRPVLSLVTSSEERDAVEGLTSSPVNQQRSAYDTPGSSLPGSRSHSTVPSRRTTLIQSPPMPQPIKNLPSMVGWPASMKEGVPGTPGWGQQASGSKTPGWSGGNVPRTPGWSTVTSPTSARPPTTPGGTGFPFSLPPTVVGQNKGKGRESMTEEDLRKARRAMPVMLREPSFVPVDHGGEVGASDDEDEESETEVEGHDDSEPETETDKGKKPSIPLKSRLRGKTKSNGGVSSLAHTAVQEEDNVTTPPARPEPNRMNTQAKKSFWMLGTPGIKAPAAWTQFSSSPSSTPVQPESRPDSSISSDNTDGYFTSNPSQASIGTPRNSEPVLTKSGPPVLGLGLAGQIASRAAADSIARAQSPGSDDDASDEAGSEDSAGTSHDHSTSIAPSPDLGSIAEAPSTPQRPSFYTRTSRSMIDLAAAEREAPTTGTKLQTIKSREVPPSKIELPARNGPLGLMSPNEWAKPPPTPAAGRAGFLWSKSKDGREIGMLKRRRSADDLTAPPPKYEPPFPGTFIPRPRDEEGKEKLPGYWCAVHIEGTLFRKMEFSAPGVQSRDRSWKKQYFILRGTSLSVYKFDPHRYPPKTEPVHPIPTVSEEESEEFLHVHRPGERRASVTVASPSTGRRVSVSESPSPAGRRSSSVTSASTVGATSRRSSASSTASPLSTSTSTTEKDPALFPNTGARRASVSSTSSHVAASSIAPHFQQNQLIRQYTLQNAESGLAADYVKRRNVVRVRAEGEQFLLQTENAREVVDWIEAFQAATNVSLDLDERPMPKIITLPRRRRRRVLGANGAAVVAGAAATTLNGDANPPVADTPEGNAAAVAAAERASRDRDRMLAEDQATPLNVTG